MTARTSPRTPARTSSTSSPSDEPPSALEKFVRFCSALKIEDGSPLALYPEQIEMVAPYFDGAKETVILVPKKNGKSTLIAAVALFHLLTTPFANCVIVAASRDQAEIILGQARMFIRQSRVLKARFRVTQRTIVSNIDGGRIRILASDKDTVDGQLPSLAIVDELHRHKSSELHTVLRLGLGGRGGQMITISTAGATADSPLGEIRARAYQMPGFQRDNKRRRSFVRSETGAFAFIEWCLNPDDDPDDLEVVKLVNPRPGRDLATLADEKEETPPWSWLRLVCNVWTEGEEPWIDPAKWDALADPELALERGGDVWLGVDVGVKHDSTGIALVAPRDDGKFAVGARIMVPPPKGELPLEEIEDALRSLAETYRVLGIAYDPWSFRRSAEILGDAGLPMREFPQSPERMSVASATLYRLIESGELVHDGDPALRAHIVAGRTKQTERGWRLVKDARGRWKIDALIALSMACALATEGEEGSTPLFVPL